ncbi:Fic family protein, partial [Microcoleus sp. herbarium7]
IEPLLLIPTYILDFLCIHPFLDGNGRMARLLTLLLLYKAGYEVGRFISLERIVERTKESYYDTLYQSSQGWHEGQHNLLPWWEYFLGVMLLSAYREFEQRVGYVTSAKGTKTAIVLDGINNLPQEFSVRELQERCPTVGIDLIRRLLRRERDAGRLQCQGRGVDAHWRKQ